MRNHELNFALQELCSPCCSHWSHQLPHVSQVLHICYFFVRGRGGSPLSGIHVFCVLLKDHVRRSRSKWDSQCFRAPNILKVRVLGVLGAPGALEPRDYELYY